jgi:hypothetical protein
MSNVARPRVAHDGEQGFEDEVLPGTEIADQPAEERPKRHDHAKNFIETVQTELFAKPFLLLVYDVLARHSTFQASRLRNHSRNLV